MWPYGASWTISVSTLMLIGWVIEIMILRETMFATQLELYRNREEWQAMKEFYRARKEFEQIMNGVPEPVALSGPVETVTPSRSKDLNLINHSSLPGKQERPLENGL